MTMKELQLMRQMLAVVQADRDEMKRFIQRVDRGDPRVCKPEYSNPKYFEKFGYDE
jgi:hypothetical protein